MPGAYVKLENLDPTRPFKGRGMTMDVSHAKEISAKVIGCAFTGNTSVSLAAYASKATSSAAVSFSSGKVAMGKMAQALFFGAKVLSIDGNFDDALARKMSEERKIYLLNSISPTVSRGRSRSSLRSWAN